MKAFFKLARLAALATLLLSPQAAAQQRATYEKLVATHAKANNVPEVLVHRVIVRESKYHPDLVGRGGTIGLMQIKLATARGVGYAGDAAGLRDPDTNLTYGVKYLAGAYRAAEGDHDRAVRLFAGGYYYVAKRQRLERLKHPEPVVASAAPREQLAREASPEAAPEPTETPAAPELAGKPIDLAAKPKLAAAQHVPLPRRRPKLADARDYVPRPAAPLTGANAAKPR
jgi:hypothetical protein